MRKPKILVLGGTGLVGSALVYYLLKQDADFAYTTRGGVAACFTPGAFYFADFSSIKETRKELDRVFQHYNPTVVVNCLYDDKNSLLTNVLVPLIVAEEYNKIDLINISTNAIFKESWTENKIEDCPLPSTEYELLKLAGERIADATHIRTSVIGVPFFQAPKKTLPRLYPRKRWTCRLWNGCTNLCLAEFIYGLIHMRCRPKKVVHFAPSETMQVQQALQMLFLKILGSAPVLKKHCTSAGKLLAGEHEIPLDTQVCLLHTALKL